MAKYLSKSSYLAGLACTRKLWLKLWRPELQAQPQGMTALIMEQGSRFGELVHRLYADAVLINIDRSNLAQAEVDTRAAIAAGALTILEATYRAGQYRVSCDVVERLSDGSWHLIEVKSSTAVKPEHIPDLAFQSYVMQRAGYRVSRCSVMHANTQGHGADISSLFNVVDVSDQVADYLPVVALDLDHLLPLLEESCRIPEMEFKKICVGCDFQSHCWAQIEQPTIYESIDARIIPTMKAQGIFYVDDIPADYELPARTRSMVDRMQQKRVDIDPTPIQKLLDELRYPLHFLDFESVATAVPLLEDSSPWQKYAFQYSLHVQKVDGEISHFEFLHDRRSDPGEALARSLLAHIDSVGSVIVYNKTMEQGVLNTLAKQFPQMADGLRQISKRIWDLEVVFRKHYRHWQWGTKSSIKYVLPSLVPELSYEDLDIGDGGKASLQWLRMIETEDRHEKEAMAIALKRYCELDTFAMVRLLEVVKKQLAALQAG